MRRTRLLILASILIVAASVGVTYRVQRALQERQSPPPPARLPENVSARAANWTWTQMAGGNTKVEVVAKDMRQVGDPARIQLTSVELHIYAKDQATFNRVTCATADFNPDTGILKSDDAVDITMNVPVDPKKPPAERPLHIRSSGVQFDTKAAKVTTDRPATFDLNGGEGEATGADYDSIARELHLHSNVRLKWYGRKPGVKPMQVTAADLRYKEVESRIYLAAPSRLERETFTLEGDNSVVTLAEGEIQQVDTQNARGTDRTPDRTLEYAAALLRITFGEGGEVQNVIGDHNARLVSTTATGQTTVTTRRIDMFFDTASGSALTKATANGEAVVESKPVVKAGVPAPDNRILRSEIVELNMRPGGKEIDTVQTHTPGTLEFLPNRPGERHRTLNAERMSIRYGKDNLVQDFRATTVATRTDRPAPKGKPPLPPSLTWSKELEAVFNERGELTRMEQWTDFRYEEGDRRARAEKATLDSRTDEITLAANARVSDPTGSTDADRIVLNQKSDAFEATGNVRSTRLQDRKDAKTPAKDKSPTPMLAGSDPVQARAAHMRSTDRNQQIRYDGNAVLWQGPNRITADVVDIDRNNQRLVATGHVVTQLLDRGSGQGDPKGQPKPAPGTITPVFTVVHAQRLVYTDKDRLAHYTGDAVLNRPNLTVNAQEIRAWVTPAEQDKDSTLDRAFADGAVKIVQAAPDRTRTATGAHGEYYAAEDRMVMTGGDPQIVDTAKGTTRGRELTWFARNDRLLVDGAEAQPAITHLRKK